MDAGAEGSCGMSEEGVRRAWTEHAHAEALAEQDELRLRFAYHPADTEEKRRAHEYVRRECLELALALHVMLPPCREASQALEYVELAMMKGNAAIARRGLPAP